MKANFQQLGFTQENRSFDCYWVKAPAFGFHWHYHPEYEITYVHRGQGIRMVGDSVSHFRAGDFVLVGSNLPHTWISDDTYNRQEDQVEVIVLQFSPQLLANPLLALPELKHLQRLAKRSGRGLHYTGSVQAQAIDLLKQLTETGGVSGLQLFLQLMNLLEQDNTAITLASAGFHPRLSDDSGERLQAICEYMHAQFIEPLRLADLAAIAHMNPTAFCRFFRRMTGQTAGEYLTDLRISKACNLLIDQSKLPISAVAFQSGFQSQTLFNRLFRRKKGMTPRAFRQEFVV